MIILDEFPTIKEFYETYWGRQPFVVRDGIDSGLFDDFIDGDTLAGLSLESDVKSRIVTTSSKGDKWTCEHGPFTEERFSTLGDKNWSLLVQNVDQYHPDTANLLRVFDFSPRWLLDDIMVSFSASGGTVGPHTDSYHVFLVQGSGRRLWTVGNTPIEKEGCFEGLDLKVLKDNIVGDDVEVTIGDVIYIPPHFAHEGRTLEAAMTFSVGFLGPKISELLIEYAHYLEQFEKQDKRYAGEGLDTQSTKFLIAPNTQEKIRDDLVDVLHSNNFSIWLSEYFSAQVDDEIDCREDPLIEKELLERLESGDVLYRPEFVKFSITTLQNKSLVLSVYGTAVPTKPVHQALIQRLNDHNTISLDNINALGGQEELMDVIGYLYNRQALFFENDDI